MHAYAYLVQQVLLHQDSCKLLTIVYPHTEKMLFQYTQLPSGHGLASAGTLQANVDTIAIKDTSHVKLIWMIFQSWQDRS